MDVCFAGIAAHHRQFLWSCSGGGGGGERGGGEEEEEGEGEEEEERGGSCRGMSQCGMRKHLDLAQVQEETACF